MRRLSAYSWLHSHRKPSFRKLASALQPGGRPGQRRRFQTMTVNTDPTYGYSAEAWAATRQLLEQMAVEVSRPGAGWTVQPVCARRGD